MLLTPIGHPATVDAGVAGAAADAARVPPDGGGGARDDGAAGAVLLRDVEQHRVAAQTARRPAGLRGQGTGQVPLKSPMARAELLKDHDLCPKD